MSRDVITAAIASADLALQIVRAGLPVSSRYSTAPSEYMSVAVVTLPPATCSGLASLGVSMRMPVTVVSVRHRAIWRSRIQQLRLAIGSDQDIARLQVAVHQEVPVQVSNGRTDLEEERDFVSKVQVCFVDVDGVAIHILHRQKGRPGSRCPASSKRAMLGWVSDATI